MLILTLRTDKPEAEIGLYENASQLSYFTWQAHRELAETIHLKLKNVLDDQQKDFNALEGIVLFLGPGSFTGLRIGASVANALADALGVPITGTLGEQWIENGIQRLLNGIDDKQLIPEYGAAPHITLPRK